MKKSKGLKIPAEFMKELLKRDRYGGFNPNPRKAKKKK